MSHYQQTNMLIAFIWCKETAIYAYGVPGWNIISSRNALVAFPLRWIQSKNYIDADVKNKHLVFLWTRNRILGRKQLPVTAAGGVASSISPAPLIYCLSLWLPLLGNIDHKLAISILLEESHEKVPEGGLLIFTGFFSALKIHSQHQTAQNISHKRKAHP